MATMRVPVVDRRGIPVMPCTAPKARALLNAGKARRRLRRARRFRLWRRPCRFQNRLARKQRLPPSTRARWEAKARIARQLAAILPLSDAAGEDVQATTQPGEGGKWNRAFSPVQVGKEHLYQLLKEQGLTLHLYTDIVTSQLRERYGLRKTQQKNPQTFSSHAVDAWVLAAATGGAHAPSCIRLWYLVPVQLHRRELHRQQPEKDGVRTPYGGTRSWGFTRGTLVRHPRYGLCRMGGADRQTHWVSLHAYRTNARLTQPAKPAQCRILTRVAFRTWLVPRTTRTTSRKAHNVKRARSDASSPGLKAGVSAPRI